MPATALIIDDEPDIRELIAMTLTRMGLDHHSAANLEEARQLLNTYNFDVCLTDMRLPDGNGVEFVRYIHSLKPSLPVAVITAHGNMEAAVEAMKNGAYDFVSKPVKVQQLRQIVTQAVAANNKNARLGVAANSDFNSSDGIERDNAESQHAEPQNAESLSSEAQSSERNTHIPTESLHELSGQRSVKDPQEEHNSAKLIGQSAPMQALRKMILKVSKTNAPVWITGESGTGKELIARLIHESGPRADKPFVAINCGAIPSELMESELFGHLKGSFTGANMDKDGLFQLADGGTLFLDEIAELPLHMQVKLLRAIQERSIRPVGGSNEIAVDARILSASHKDLATEVDGGRFRHDLYYRLNVISLHSPSLRDRKADLPELCKGLLKRLQAPSQQAESVTITSQAFDALADYHFPGNVRELENLLERSLALIENNTIDVGDLHLSNTAKRGNHESGRVALSTSIAGATLSSKAASNLIASTSGNTEASRIVDALNNTRWNRKEAAKKLGLTYRQLRYRIQQLGIDNNNDS